MKILITVPDICVGGVTTSVYNFINELCERENDVTFLDFSSNIKNQNIHPKANQIFLSGKARYWVLGKGDIIKAPLIKKPFLMVLGLLKKTLNKIGLWNNLIFNKIHEHFDVAVAFRQCAPCYSFVLNKVNADKKIGFVHGDVDFMGDISSWQPLMKKFDKIAYVSNAVKEGFIKKYPELEGNACTIYNMLDYSGIKKRSEEVLEYDFDNLKFNIVTVARISNLEKRIDWIPMICRTFLDNGIVDFHWYIVGSGEDLHKDIEFSKELGVETHITFVNQTDNPFKFVKNADLSVLPTRSEAFGLVIVEAMILNVPVVVCKYPSLSEIFEDGKYGLVAEQSVESVTEKVKFLIQNKEEYNRIKKNCKNYEFSNDVAYEQFLDSIN